MTTTYDKHGVWVLRPEKGDPLSYEINLNADPDHKIALVSGQTFDGYDVTQTRNYTIRELRDRVRRLDAARARADGPPGRAHPKR
jgi:hypothetical protein